MSNLREPLGILFEQYATDHSVILYGDPSPELIQTAKTIGVEGPIPFSRDLIRCHRHTHLECR
jgi:hypothetical protein